MTHVSPSRPTTALHAGAWLPGLILGAALLGACLAVPGAHSREDRDGGTPAADSGPAPQPDAATATAPQPDAATATAPQPDAGVVTDVPGVPVRCFQGQTVLATSTSRLNVQAVIPYGTGWVVFLLNSAEPGDVAAFVDAEGHVTHQQPFALGAGRLVSVGDSYLLESFAYVQRIDVVAGAFVAHAPFPIAWPTSLATAVLGPREVRLLWHHVDPDTSDRLHVGDLELDDSEPFGFSFREQTLPADLTAAIGGGLGHPRYRWLGSHLRVVGPPTWDQTGPWRTQLFDLGDGSPHGLSGAWELLEEAIWDEPPSGYDYVTDVLPDGARMVVMHQAPGHDDFEFSVDALPGRTTAAGGVGSLGRGDNRGPLMLDDARLGVLDRGTLRVIAASDLAPLGALTIPTPGTFAGAALNGDRLAVVATRSDAPGELSVSIQCGDVAP